MTAELSAPERRYLLAACAASPLYAFRPRADGRLASFADGDTDAIVFALARAGMVETSMGWNAQLTELGRAAARDFAADHGRAAPKRTAWPHAWSRGLRWFGRRDGAGATT